MFPLALGDLRSGINHEHGTSALDQLSRKRGPERTCPYYQTSTSIVPTFPAAILRRGKIEKDFGKALLTRVVRSGEGYA